MRVIFAAVDQKNYQRLKPLVDQFTEIQDTIFDWIGDRLPPDTKVDWSKLYKEEDEIRYKIYTSAEQINLLTETLHDYNGEERVFHNLSEHFNVLNPEGYEEFLPYLGLLLSAEEVQGYFRAYQRFLAPINVDQEIRAYAARYRDLYATDIEDPYGAMVRAQKKFMDVITFCYRHHYAFLRMNDGTP